jgi:hypothetical protein
VAEEGVVGVLAARKIKVEYRAVRGRQYSDLVDSRVVLMRVGVTADLRGRVKQSVGRRESNGCVVT